MLCEGDPYHPGQPGTLEALGELSSVLVDSEIKILGIRLVAQAGRF